MRAFIPVLLSSKAIEEVKNIISNKGIPLDFGLRIGVRGAGCAGVSHFIGFDKKKDNDEEFFVEDIKLFIEKKHMLYLAGWSVDFKDEADERGFFFIDKDKIR